LKYGEDDRATAQTHALSAGPFHLGRTLSKEKIGGLGLMPKTALVKYPIASFITSIYERDTGTECLILRPKRQTAGASAGGRNW
jgi:hypothetical protein